MSDMGGSDDARSDFQQTTFANTYGYFLSCDWGFERIAVPDDGTLWMQVLVLPFEGSTTGASRVEVACTNVTNEYYRGGTLLDGCASFYLELGKPTGINSLIGPYYGDTSVTNSFARTEWALFPIHTGMPNIL